MKTSVKFLDEEDYASSETRKTAKGKVKLKDVLTGKQFKMLEKMLTKQFN